MTVNRVISASAGTGKTHTLTALYLGLLEGRLELREDLRGDGVVGALEVDEALRAGRGQARRTA